MKNVNKLAVVIGFAAVLVSAGTALLGAEAISDPKAYVASYRERGSEIPSPVKVVAPEPVEAKAGSVDVAFVVDAKGKPTEITIAYASDEALVEPVIEAIERWKFNPATRGGVPVATKVLLPVRFTVASND